jgi:two-component system, OmpR family, phosphate regulon response regulator PhoB
VLEYNLRQEGYDTFLARDGHQGLREAREQAPDLIVLDLMLPGVSGLEILKELRRRPETHTVPVILLTARKEEQDRIEGLRLGADDYVAKPFSPQELILRVGAVLRRSVHTPNQETRGKVLRVGPFVLDPGAVRVEVEGRDLELTPTEFKLLQVLMGRRGRVQSRRKLLESVWEVTANIATRTVDMHVQRLRTKLGNEADWIETVRGFGYRFRSDGPLT